MYTRPRFREVYVTVCVPPTERSADRLGEEYMWLALTVFITVLAAILVSNIKQLAL